MRASRIGCVGGSVLVAVLTGCSSPGAPATSAADPVTILHRLTGCIIASNVTHGVDDGFGGNYAACLQPGQPGDAYTDEATAYTVDSPAHRDAQLHALQSQHLPMTRFLVGPGFVLTETGHLAHGVTAFTPPLTTIATQSGARLLPAP